jgi:hypothetical protein
LKIFTRAARAIGRNVCVVAICSRREGVEDIVQSVFRSFFRRVGQGFYDCPDEDELWKLFLVIGVRKIRNKATYHHAIKRSALPRRTEADWSMSALWRRFPQPIRLFYLSTFG